MTTWIPLRYFLSRTVFTVRAHIRYVVAYDEFGGHLEPRADAELSVGTVADRRYRCTTTFEFAPGGSGGPGVEITSDGLIRTIGAVPQSAPDRATRGPGESRRSDWGLNRGEDSVEDGADRVVRSSWTGPGDLRRAFDRANPRIAAVIEDLSARAEQFLAGMRMSDGLAEVEKFGQVLAIAERELATADRIRREWIAAQGFTHSHGTWHLDVEQMLYRDERDPLPGFPARICPSEGPARELAERFGVLMVAYDPERVVPPEDEPSEYGQLDRVEEILLRRPRPVTVAVYRRIPKVLRAPGDQEPDWVLDTVLGDELDVVDAASELEAIVPRAFEAGGRGAWLELHPDGAPHAVGISSGPVVPITATENVCRAEPPAAGPGLGAVTSAATAAEGIQRALLRASDELTRLAVAHATDGEQASGRQEIRSRGRPDHGHA